MLKKISDNINIIIEKFGILNGSLDENKTKNYKQLLEKLERMLLLNFITL